MTTSHVPTQAERIATLETIVKELVTQQQKMNSKIDELLAIRNKGVGAFWLASTLLGTGIVGFIVQLIDWWKHA